jgi:hypothetical protein
MRKTEREKRHRKNENWEVRKTKRENIRHGEGKEEQKTKIIK